MSSPRANILFVTGTDTGIGKTETVLLLANGLRQCSVKFRLLKPVETGCEGGADGLEPKDALRLAEAARQSLDQTVSYCFRAPLAGYLAAKLEGKRIDLPFLQEQITQAACGAELVIVEGAGGLLVPFDKEHTFADLVKQCGGAVVVVVGSKLGALNHAALTFEVLASRKIPVVGYVFNDLFNSGKAEYNTAGDDERPAYSTNRELLQEIAAYYRLKEVAYIAYGATTAGNVAASSPIQNNLAQLVIEYFSLQR